jgi:hypothetical protein
MMSCTTSAAWSRPVSSPCYTEHGQCCGAILSGRITTIAMFRSGQLGMRYTVKPNYSGISARLAGALITRNRTLDTSEPSCVPGAARHFFIPVVHNPLGAVGTWQHQSSLLGEARPAPRGSVGAHLGREARSKAEKYVAASELSSREGRARSHETHDSAGAHLDREVRPKAVEHVAASELNSARRRGPGPRAMWQHRSSPQ